MKKITSVLTLAVASLMIVATAQAADRKVMLSIDNAMAANDAKSRLGDSVKFYFGEQSTPKILKRVGSDKTSQKTNAFGKSDEKACNWAFLSAMLSLQKSAVSMGANAIVNITSNYNNIPNVSNTEFECHAGALMAGVALKGDFVKIPE